MKSIILKNENAAYYFTVGDHPDFDLVTTICKNKKTGKFYALDQILYERHMGTGQNEYANLDLYEVEQSVKTTGEKEWDIVKQFKDYAS